MAARTWTQTSGNNWSTAANWDGGASVPGAGDTVTFNSTSTANCTIDNLGAFNGSVTIASTYSGVITQGSGVTISLGAYSQAAGTFTCAADATCTWTTFSLTGGTFNQGGAFACTTFTVGAATYVGSSASMSTTAVVINNNSTNLTATSGTWSLAGNWTQSNNTTFTHNSGTIAITAGSVVNDTRSSFNLFTCSAGISTVVIQTGTTAPFGASPSVTAGTFAANGTISGTGTLTVTGSAQVGPAGTFSGFSSFVITNGGWTCNAGGTIPASLNITMNITDTGARSFSGGGQTYGNFRRSGSGTGTVTILGSNTFSDFRDDDGSVGHTILFTSGTTQTISTLTMSGAAGKLVTLRSVTPTSIWTLTTSAGAKTADYVVIQDSTVNASPTWTAGSNSVNAGGNTNWLFTAAGGATDPVNGGSVRLLKISQKH